MNLSTLLTKIRQRGYSPELAFKDEHDTEPLTHETLIIRGNGRDITWEISYADLRAWPDRMWEHAIAYRLPEV